MMVALITDSFSNTSDFMKLYSPTNNAYSSYANHLSSNKAICTGIFPHDIFKKRKHKSKVGHKFPIVLSWEVNFLRYFSK